MLGGDTLSKISEQVGAPQDKTRQALRDIMAVLTGAVAKKNVSHLNIIIISFNL